VDTVLLTCTADGNPKPDIVWRKLGQQSIFRIEEQLKFRSVVNYNYYILLVIIHRCCPVRVSDGGSCIC
jgi:hypothetical protein